MSDGKPKRAIIVGASSGIGRALAKVLAREGYSVGVAARRLPLLEELQSEIGQRISIKQMDVSDAPKAASLFLDLIEEMGGVDLVVISAGIGYLNPELTWEKEAATIAVNVTGFIAVAQAAMQYFLKQGSGHLVNISSIAALRGSSIAPAYNASKAFASNYMEGLRQKVYKLRLPITITDIQPGFVDTAMAQGEGLFWVASPEKAAEQIYQTITRKKQHAYITKRWRLFAWAMKLAPNWLYDRMAG
ncbi:MAG: SDR family NAD(P)-dependent oxidoreductase [Anaerolineae bacterium]|nr:SDR family NAD(P)-dependent oxidoreductase [Anaerolineae bacterium]